MPTSQADMEQLLKDKWHSDPKRLDLYCGCLKAYTAGEMQQLCSLILKAHPDVKLLLMSDNELDDAHAAAVPEALERLPHLENLLLYGNNKFGGEAAAKIFIAAVRHCLHLHTLFMPPHCDPNTVDWAQLGVTMSPDVLAAAEKDRYGDWNWGAMVKKQREMQAAGLVAPLPTVPDAGGSAAVLEVEKEEQRQLEAALALSKLTFQQQGVAHLSLDPAAPAARSMASSHFKAIYESTECPEIQPDLLGPVSKLIKCYCQQYSIPKEAGTQFYKELEREAFERKEEVLGEIPAAAQRLWTSGQKLKTGAGGGVELCSMLNAALRSDDREQVGHACPILRAINQLLVIRGVRDTSTVPFPPQTFRGGALPPEHMPFFERMLRERATFRVPGLLATSFVRKTAERFALQAEHRDESVVLWVIHLHPEGEHNMTKRCRHVNFIDKTHFEGEKEFLFAAYAPFKVKEITWAPDKKAYADEPHVIELEACMDGRREREDLPLAPWY